MIYRISILVVFMFGASLTAYPQAKPQTPSEAEKEPPSPLAVPRDYKYNQRGRRDPFVNPVPPAPPPAAAPVERALPPRPPGLPGVLMAEAVIAGVVVSKTDPSMTVVSIGAPGGKMYFARVGDRLFDAVVKAITFDTVTFALTDPGGGGEKPSREVVRSVRPPSGENK
jgi:hypothetical protein